MPGSWFVICYLLSLSKVSALPGADCVVMTQIVDVMLVTSYLMTHCLALCSAASGSGYAPTLY